MGTVNQDKFLHGPCSGHSRKSLIFFEIEVEQAKTLLCIDWWVGFGFVWQGWARWRPLASHVGDYARKIVVCKKWAH